jgi:hypothetical protein
MSSTIQADICCSLPAIPALDVGLRAVGVSFKRCCERDRPLEVVCARLGSKPEFFEAKHRRSHGRCQVFDIPFRTPSIIAVRSFILIGFVMYSSTPAFDARALASELVTPVSAAMWTRRNLLLRSTARIFSVASKPSQIGMFMSMRTRKYADGAILYFSNASRPLIAHSQSNPSLPIRAKRSYEYCSQHTVQNLVRTSERDIPSC